MNNEFLVQESHRVQNVNEDLYALDYWGIFFLEVVAQVALLAEVHVQGQSFGLLDLLWNFSIARLGLGQLFLLHLFPVQKLQHIVAIDNLHHCSLSISVLEIVPTQYDTFPDVFSALSPIGPDHLQDSWGVASEREQSGQFSQEGVIFFWRF